jgi:hypothetical protein
MALAETLGQLCTLALQRGQLGLQLLYVDI